MKSFSLSPFAKLSHPFLQHELCRRAGRRCQALSLLWVLVLSSSAALARGQVNVVTAHNDIARTGQNLNETILNTSNVNSSQFGRLFSVHISGFPYGQPLYVSQLAIPGKGTHNVVYTATSADMVYALDADSNGGANASPLWSLSLQSNTTSASGLSNNFGVAGTPVIDLPSKTMYVVSSETQDGTAILRLHALDITTGAEKLGGPVLLQGSVRGVGNASVNGVLTFDPSVQYQRPGLLLLNGIVYVGIGSYYDQGLYHGWIFSFEATSLKKIDLYCDSPNGTAGGIWMSGAGLAAEVNDPAKPFGRMFVVTGNGSYAAGKPYDSTMSYGMSVVDLDLTGGKMTVQDEFTPHNQEALDLQDGDLGSGGAVLLPPQSLGSGNTLYPLIEEGKSGTLYILDRNNLGGFNSGGDKIVQEVQTPESGTQSWGAGVWGSTAYWNNKIYTGGTNPGTTNNLTAYSFINGKLSERPTSETAEQFGSPSPTPSISANGVQNGIVWFLNTNGIYVIGPQVLLAYDAGDLANPLYSSNTNLSRDNPGAAIKYTVPTIANGKVYVGAIDRLSVFGLLSGTPTAATPVFSPPSGTFSASRLVTISDATSGASIFYTTDGSSPTASSTRYTGPITVTTDETITAIASDSGYLQSAPASATYTSTERAVNPTFSLSPGAYAGTRTVALHDSSSGAGIFYTVDGSTPTTSSNLYTGPITVSVTETIQAFATAPGLLSSSIVTAGYQISPAYSINYPLGFADAEGPVQFNGSTDLDDVRLQLTNGGKFEAGSAFFTTPVNIQSFTTDFVFQLSNPSGDGMTFTIQSNGPAALGALGSGLGYAGIPKSVAIKFDLYNDSGEGPDSAGLYIDGAAPTVPSLNLTNTGINLHNGDQIDAHITYDGAYLTLTLVDAITGARWSHVFTVDIPAVVGSSTAYVGFTGGTGVLTSSQKLTYWTYVPGPLTVPNLPTGFQQRGVWWNGAKLWVTSAQLSNGSPDRASSLYFPVPVDVRSFTTDFDFQLKQAVADGFTFVLQNKGLTAVGAAGEGLGYATIPHSVAIKFDIYNNAGEGNNSTGVYVNGAYPTVPAIDLKASGLNLSSGDVIHAHITYDGTTLSWTLSDPATNHTSTHSVVINIPQSIGNNTAYAGFTAGTGGQTAIQNILDWTLTNP